MRRFIIIGWILMMVLLLAMESYAQVSLSTVLFLRIAAGARAAGMGESFVAIADDATATHWNPAGLGFYPLASTWIEYEGKQDHQFKSLALLRNDRPEGNYKRYDLWAISDTDIHIWRGEEWQNYLSYSLSSGETKESVVRKYTQEQNEERLKKMLERVTLEKGIAKLPYNLIFMDSLNFLTSDENNLWVGANSGLYKYDGKVWKRFSTQDGLVSDKALSMSFTPGGTAFVGTDSGVVRFDGKSFTRMYLAPEVKDQRITQIAAKNDKEIWAAAPEALLKFDGNLFVPYYTMSVSSFKGLYQEIKKYLGREDEGKLGMVFKRIEDLNYIGKEQISSNQPLKIEYNLPFEGKVTSLAFDRKGDLLVGTEKGLLKIGINPRFENTGIFTEELAKARLDGKWGYIDKTGSFMINPQYDDAGSFSEGLARVRVGSKWGYIDKTGKPVINLQYDDAGSFSEGLAKVRIGNKWGYIDKTGTQVSKQQFDVAESFSEGLASVKVGDKWGFIDKTCMIIINMRFDNAGSFSEGLASVKVGDKWGFIGKAGDKIIDPQFDNVGFFSEELSKVRISDRWGYIDKDGKTVINPQYDDAGSFSEGLARVRVGSKWGYIDKTGKPVINLQYDDVGSFSEGLAKVRIGNKWGYIDKTGTQVSKQQFDVAESFSEGLASVKVGDKWGFIDKLGNIIIAFDAIRWKLLGYRKYEVKNEKTVEVVAEKFLPYWDKERVENLSQKIVEYNHLPSRELNSGQVLYVYANSLGSRILSVAMVGEDNLFVGTEFGTLRFDGGIWGRYYHSNLERARTHTIIYKDKDIFFGTEDKAVVYAHARKELTFMHATLLPNLAEDVYYEYLSYVQNTEYWGTIGGNITFISYGTIPRTTETGQVIGDINPYEAAITLSYGTRMGKNLALGLGAKFIYSHLSDQGAGKERGSGTGSSFAVDAGLIYRTPLKKLTLGAAVTNLGPNVSYIDVDQSDPLPRNLALGFAYKIFDTPYNKLTAVGEMNKELVDVSGGLGKIMEQAVKNVGVEYWYASYVALRAGYIYDKIGDIRTATFGAGLRISLLNLDFAYVPANEDVALANTTRVSGTIRF